MKNKKVIGYIGRYKRKDGELVYIFPREGIYSTVKQCEKHAFHKYGITNDDREIAEVLEGEVVKKIQ